MDGGDGQRLCSVDDPSPNAHRHEWQRGRQAAAEGSVSTIEGHKPDSVGPEYASAPGDSVIYLRDQPETIIPNANVRKTRRAVSRSLFDLAPEGVYRAISLTLDPVVSYTTFSPLPSFAKATEGKPSLAQRRWAVCFLWHWPSITLTRNVPRFHEASCPAVSGLSSRLRPALRAATPAWHARLRAPPSSGDSDVLCPPGSPCLESEAQTSD